MEKKPTDEMMVVYNDTEIITVTAKPNSGAIISGNYTTTGQRAKLVAMFTGIGYSTKKIEEFELTTD